MFKHERTLKNRGQCVWTFLPCFCSTLVSWPSSFTLARTPSYPNNNIEEMSQDSIEILATFFRAQVYREGFMTLWHWRHTQWIMPLVISKLASNLMGSRLTEGLTGLSSEHQTLPTVSLHWVNILMNISPIAVKSEFGNNDAKRLSSEPERETFSTKLERSWHPNWKEKLSLAVNEDW